MGLALLTTTSTKRQRATSRRCSLVALGLSLLATPALARSAGIAAAGCEGCHQGGKVPTVTLTSDPLSPAVGQDITLTIRVSQANGSTAGFYLTTANPAPGAFQAIESGTAATATEAVHTTPRAGTGGSTTFKVKWSATQATGVKFDVYAVSANADRSNRGDGAATGELELLIGCTGTTYYIDQDGDGYGSTDPAYPSRKDCSLPVGYAALPGDCDDFHASVHPGAVEQCDLSDDNCDGKVDEGARMVCGVGLCARYATGCTSMCTPAAPFAESCNGYDDDCDGVVDNGSNELLCGDSSAVCILGHCQGGNPGTAGTGAGGGATNPSGGSGLAATSAPASCSLGTPQAPRGWAWLSTAVVAVTLAFGRRTARRSAAR